MAQHAHVLICSRFFKLYNINKFMETHSQLVMNWMGCVATNDMGSRLVSLFDDISYPLHRMLKELKEGIVSMDGIILCNFLKEIDHYCSVLNYRWLLTLMVELNETKWKNIFLV